MLSRLCGVCAIAACLPGCSVRYANSARGIQHVWGIGRTTWETEELANDLVAVSSGFRLPGLVLGVGPDFVGVTLGYHIRERMQIVPGEELADGGAFLNGHPLAPNRKARWGIGHFRTRTPHKSGIAVIRGEAAAGLTLAAENGRPEAGAGWQSVQATSITGEDVFLELQSTNHAWPYFNFPETDVSAGIADPKPTKSPEP